LKDPTDYLLPISITLLGAGALAGLTYLLINHPTELSNFLNNQLLPVVKGVYNSLIAVGTGTRKIIG